MSSVAVCGVFDVSEDLDLTSFGIPPGNGSRTRLAVSGGPVAGLVPVNGNALSVFVAVVRALEVAKSLPTSKVLVGSKPSMPSHS